RSSITLSNCLNQFFARRHAQSSPHRMLPPLSSAVADYVRQPPSPGNLSGVAMEELSKHGKLGLAGARAGLGPETPAKYREVGKFPSELKQPRSWRTREDPFEEDWPAIAARLVEAPELEAKTLFELLLESQPEKYEAGQVRTLQRRVREWRATAGPDKEGFFAQVHRPGEAVQTDFSWGNELGISMAGAPLPP